MSSADILIKGRNRELLFEKLKRAKVPIIKSWQKGDDLVIRVKYKDLKKAFAILGNMWYNKLIRYHGSVAVYSIVGRHLALIVAAIAFFVFAFLSDAFIIFSETEGASQSESLDITSLLKENGFKSFVRFSDLDIDKIKRDILKSNDNYNFVTVFKRANTLFVKIIRKPPDQSVVYSDKNIVAKESGVITYIGVLRGRALKAVGDTVLAGETVIEGSVFDGENYYPDEAAGKFTIRCEREFDLPVPDTEENTALNEIAALKAFLDKDGATCEYTFSEIAGGYILKIKLTYFLTESGGILEQNDG